MDNVVREKESSCEIGKYAKLSESAHSKLSRKSVEKIDGEVREFPTVIGADFRREEEEEHLREPTHQTIGDSQLEVVIVKVPRATRQAQEILELEEERPRLRKELSWYNDKIVNFLIDTLCGED